MHNIMSFLTFSFPSLALFSVHFFIPSVSILFMFIFHPGSVQQSMCRDIPGADLQHYKKQDKTICALIETDYLIPATFFVSS